MPIPAPPARPVARPARTRAARRPLVALSVSVLALAFAAPALAVDTVDMGAAGSYSVLGNSVTSNGATAMSENLGSAGVLAGDTPPIVLGETHLGDADAIAAKAALKLAYGDAVLRTGVPVGVADLGGASGAGRLQLDGGDGLHGGHDPDARRRRRSERRVHPPDRGLSRSAPRRW